MYVPTVCTLTYIKLQIYLKSDILNLHFEQSKAKLKSNLYDVNCEFCQL